VNDGLFVRRGANDEALTGFVCDVDVKIGLAALAWQANMVLIFFSHDREAGAASAALASSLGQFCPYPASRVCHG